MRTATPPAIDYQTRYTNMPELFRQKLAEQDAIDGGPPVLEPGVTIDMMIEELHKQIGDDLRARGIDPKTIRYEQKYEGE